MSIDTDVVRKVSKLLNLSGNNPNEAEATAAAVKAQAMMLTEGITMAQVREYDESNQGFVLRAGHKHIEMSIGDRVATWQSALATGVTKAMGGKAVRVHRAFPHLPEGVIVFGVPPEPIVDTILYLRMVLDIESAKAMRDRSDHSIHGRTYRLGWLSGATERIVERLKEAYRAREAESEATGRALAVIGDVASEGMTQWLNDNKYMAYAGVGPGGVKTYNGQAYQTGVNSANAMPLNQTPVGAGARGLPS